MKKTILIAFMLILSVSLSEAVPMTWTDTYDPDDTILMNQSNTIFSFTHNITDGENGFIPFSDFITYASLSISLINEANNAVARIDLPGILGDRFYNFAFDDNTLGVSFLGYLQLNSYGLLDVSIIRRSGNFSFDYSILTASGEDNTLADRRTASVPEPGTLLLIGSGLLGVGLLRRFRS